MIRARNSTPSAIAEAYAEHARRHPIGPFGLLGGGSVIVIPGQRRVAPIKATPQPVVAVVPRAAAPVPTARQRLRAHPYAIGGYACLFNCEADRLYVGREVVRPGAFARALSAGGWFLLIDHLASAAHNQAWRSPIRNMSPSRVLASMADGTFYAEEDRIGLWCEMSLPSNAVGRAAIDYVRRGKIHGLSTGSTSATGANVDGVLMLEHIAAWEISLCVANSPGRPGTWVALLGEADQKRRGLLDDRRTA